MFVARTLGKLPLVQHLLLQLSVVKCLLFFAFQAQLEEFRQRVDTLNKRLADMDVKHAGLASQNKILEETAAAIQARQEKVS